MVCTQTDGERGLIHNHILINDVSMIDSKACCRFQYHHTYVAPWTDEITARYTIPDFGEKPAEKLAHAERAMQKRGEQSYKTEIRKRVLEAMKSFPITGCVRDHIRYGSKALKEHLEIYERVVIRSEFTSFD